MDYSPEEFPLKAFSKPKCNYFPSLIDTADGKCLDFSAFFVDVGQSLPSTCISFSPVFVKKE